MSDNNQKRVIGRGAAYIYIETISSLISGYIFWLVVSKVTTSAIIGTSSALVSFAAIVAVVAGMGIPTGVLRFVGKALSQNKIEETQIFFGISLLLLSTGIFVCGLIIIVLQHWINLTFGFDFGLMLIAIVLIASTDMTMLFRSVVIASLKTKSLPIIFISSSLAKLILTIILLEIGTGTLGLTFGFTFNHILSSVLLAMILLVKIFKAHRINNPLKGFINYAKKILLASMVNWIPMLILTLGTQLGTIVVFGSQGANQAAIYFLALTIVTGITSVMNSLFTIALPTLSGLSNYRKRFTWQTIRLSTIILLPFSCSLIFYSNEIMKLLGKVYVQGSLALEILLLSMLPMCIITGINTLVYSYGNYRYVLMIGLAVSMPQTILYLLLVPPFETVGAAMAYTIGSLIGCLVSVIVAKKIGLLLFWKDLIIVFIVPTSIGYVLSYLNVPFVLGILATISLSYILLLKIRVVTSSDVQDFLEVLPSGISISITRIINRLKKN